MYEDFLRAFVLLLVVIDPFLSAVFFATMTGDATRKQRFKNATLATSVAFGLLIIFIFIGPKLLDIMNISFSSFKIAGGIILLIMGVQNVLGLEFTKKNKQRRIAAIVIGTPLLSGPAALTTVVVLTNQFGYMIPLVAATGVMILTWPMLYFANTLMKRLGESITETLSRILGLLLAAIAVQFIAEGIKAFI